MDYLDAAGLRWCRPHNLPNLPSVKPLLAHIYEPHRVTYPCYVQPKLNGIRALYQNGCFQSRDQIPFTAGLLDHIARPLLQTFDPSVILDGELYVHGWPLQRINAAVTPVRQQPTEDTLKVEYHVFDVVDFQGSFWDRYKPIKTIQRMEDSVVHHVPTTYVLSQQDADNMYSSFVSLGYEGMMYRLGDCPYTVPKQEWDQWKHCNVGRPGYTRFLSDKNNRCWHLLKRKDWQDDEYICIGIEEGEGKLAGTVGALVCRVNTSDEVRVGSGLTDEQRHFYWRNPPIGKLIKVKYLVLSSDGIPLNPTVHPDHIIQ